jgi:hypothetical protein
MTNRTRPNTWNRTELLSLLSVTGTLAGLCITIVALMNTFDRARTATTIVDDVFVLCAAVFLVNIYLIFWALRAKTSTLSMTLSKIADGVFLLALSGMTVASFIMTYTIW